MRQAVLLNLVWLLLNSQQAYGKINLRLFPNQYDPAGWLFEIGRCEDKLNEMFPTEAEIHVRLTLKKLSSLRRAYSISEYEEVPNGIDGLPPGQIMTRALFKHFSTLVAGANNLETKTDIVIEFNRDWRGWYRSWPYEVFEETYSFYSTCLHEVYHGLVMNYGIGSLAVSNDERTAELSDRAVRDRYLRFVGVKTNQGFCALQSYKEYPELLYKALTSDRLYFGTGNKALVKLLASKTFDPSASIVHPDYPPGADRLMAANAFMGMPEVDMDDELKQIQNVMLDLKAAPVHICEEMNKISSFVKLRMAAPTELGTKNHGATKNGPVASVNSKQKSGETGINNSSTQSHWLQNVLLACTVFLTVRYRKKLSLSRLHLVGSRARNYAHTALTHCGDYTRTLRRLTIDANIENQPGQSSNGNSQRRRSARLRGRT